MALSAAQKVTLNRYLAQFPTSASNPTLLADMWELLPVNAQVTAAKTAWKNEVAAKIAAQKTTVDSSFDDATSTINSA